MTDHGVHDALEARHFRVGQSAVVDADQGYRRGTVTKVGRTRVSIKHPRNKAGDMVERPYPMERIVQGIGIDDEGHLLAVFGDGSIWPVTHSTAGTRLRVLFDEREN